VGAMAIGAAGSTLSSLASVPITPLRNGRPAADTVAASTLWKDRGAVVFVVRRPG